jgi:hypothetical protein
MGNFHFSHPDSAVVIGGPAGHSWSALNSDPQVKMQEMGEDLCGSAWPTR